MTPSSALRPPRPKTLFPLIRHVSARVSPWLVRTPLSANHITTLSLICGLAGSALLLDGTYYSTLAGVALFFMGYVLDNCDGEVARMKNQCSDFGDKYDTFVDWVVHSAFFAALGVGVMQATGDRLWMWLGLIGAAGGTINYFVGLAMDARFRAEMGEEYDPTGREGVDVAPRPETKKQWAVFILRELSRSDFCFIVLALAPFGGLWFLLPTAAVGAHAYWMTQFFRGARDYHV